MTFPTVRHLRVCRPKRTVLVLCWFEFVTKRSGITRTYSSSIMIEVENSEQIPIIFNRAMQAKLDGWYDRTWTPKPMSWTLTAYLPENGKPVF